MNRPILFSAPMVREIITGNKTMTRRVMKPQPVLGGDGMWQWKDCQWMDSGLGFPQSGIEDHAPWHPGDVLWVRETWARQFGLYWHKAGLEVDENGYCKDGYWADDAAAPGGKIYIATKAPEKWKPSIHMPKDAARLFLRVTGVRVERLQDMSEEDALDEGYSGICPYEHMDFSTTPPEPCYNSDSCCCGEWYCNHSIPEAFGREIWDPINAKRNGGAHSWDANPWVWVISFGRCEKPQRWP